MNLGNKGNKAYIGIGALITLAIGSILLISILPAISTTNVVTARTLLENQGYAVMSATEYNLLIEQVDSVLAKQASALETIETTAITSQDILNVLLLHVDDCDKKCKDKDDKESE